MARIAFVVGQDFEDSELKIPYDEPIPEALVRKIAKYCVKNVSKRGDDAFW